MVHLLSATCSKRVVSSNGLSRISRTRKRVSYSSQAATETRQPILHIAQSSIYQLGASNTSGSLFRDVSWTIQPQDAWAVLAAGPTSSKTFLLQALTGHLRISPPPPPPDGLFPFLHGRDPHDCVSLVSFAHRPRAAGGEFYDFTARYGAVREEDKKTLRETFFPEAARPLHDLAIPSFHSHPDIRLAQRLDQTKERARRALFEDLTEKLGLSPLLDLPVVALSNGQTRKARIVKALLAQPELLILDEPLTGLDMATRGLVLSLLQALHTSPKGPHIVLGMRKQDPLPEWTTHVALIREDGKVHTGTKEDVLKTSASSLTQYGWTPPAKDNAKVAEGEKDKVLVRLSDVSVTYTSRRVLKGINWTIHENSRWHLLGSNGAGKTTLLAMLTGEHPQSYTQSSKLSLFSRPRAKWPTPQLSSRVGRVSPEMHNAFPRREGMSVWEAIGTGFEGGFVPRGKRRVGFGEDGEALEEGGEIEQWRIQRMWNVLRGLGPTAWRTETKQSDASRQEELEGFAARAFVDLSPGEQSIVLLMRALVGRPLLVLLDEAWAGMDEGMVRAARTYLREGGGLEEGQACVVVSHWEEEVPWGKSDGVRKFCLEDGIGREI